MCSDVGFEVINNVALDLIRPGLALGLDAYLKFEICLPYLLDL